MPMEGLIPPVGPEGIGYWIPAVMQEASKRQSHLLFHSDKDGMYLPIEAMKVPILSSGPDLPVLGTCTPLCTSCTQYGALSKKDWCDFFDQDRKLLEKIKLSEYAMMMHMQPRAFHQRQPATFMAPALCVGATRP